MRKKSHILHAMLEHANFLFLALLLVVAFLYASVGHGGASGYLALMALFNMEASMMKTSALILNIFVSLIAFIQYYRGGHFRWKLFWPFAVASIPAAAIGGLITLDPHIYKKILGVLLIFPIIKLLGFFYKKNDDEIKDREYKEVEVMPALMMGTFIGLMSGMIGIGGGIILSPFILLMRWGNMKQTAAVSALFIFVNSITGLISQLSLKHGIDPEIYAWVIVAVMGGALGSYFGNRKFSNLLLTRLLAIVLIIAAYKLFFT